MDFFTIFGVAVALAIDAFAVSLSVGISLKKVNLRQFFRLSWHFGLFQALMPIFGWFLGHSAKFFVKDYTHWIAFILLVCVGFNMIKESFKEDDSEIHKKDPTKGLSLVILSVATSIDALAIGFSLSMVTDSIFFPSLIIGIVACLFTIMGLNIGQKLGKLPKIQKYGEIFGGIFLFLIGIKVLYENGVF
ncbi:MAG: manganese efflux pump [Desulfobacterales bacterium]|nr:manganese efflux pump [Desulfobacterales bacterium]